MAITQARPGHSPFIGQAMSEDELADLPRDGYKHELVDGRVEGVPTEWVREDVAARLMLLLAPATRGVGRLVGSGLGCRMANGNIRSPDVCFVIHDRVPRGAERDEFFEGTPDLFETG